MASRDNAWIARLREVRQAAKTRLGRRAVGARAFEVRWGEEPHRRTTPVLLIDMATATAVLGPHFLPRPTGKKTRLGPKINPAWRHAEIIAVTEAALARPDDPHVLFFTAWYLGEVEATQRKQLMLRRAGQLEQIAGRTAESENRRALWIAEYDERLAEGEDSPEIINTMAAHYGVTVPWLRRTINPNARKRALWLKPQRR